MSLEYNGKMNLPICLQMHFLRLLCKWLCSIMQYNALVPQCYALCVSDTVSPRGAGEARHADEDSSVGESLAHLEAREALDAIIAAALQTLELGADASIQQVSS